MGFFTLTDKENFTGPTHLRLRTSNSCKLCSNRWMEEWTMDTLLLHKLTGPLARWSEVNETSVNKN